MKNVAVNNNEKCQQIVNEACRQAQNMLVILPERDRDAFMEIEARMLRDLAAANGFPLTEETVSAMVEEVPDFSEYFPLEVYAELPSGRLFYAFARAELMRTQAATALKVLAAMAA